MPDEMNAIKSLPDISFIDNKTIDQVRQEMVADYEVLSPRPRARR